MKFKHFFLIFLLIGIVYSQDRSTIFNTGTPDSTNGHIIYNDNNVSYSFSERFTTNNEYIMAAFSFFFGTISDPGYALLEFRTDNENSPGDLIFERTIGLDQNFPNGREYTITVNTECAELQPGENYWLVVHAEEGSEFTWLYPSVYNYPIAASEDLGLTWSETEYGVPGAARVYADAVYYPENDFPGDMNDDFIYDVMDIVSIVDLIIDAVELTPYEMFLADISGDGNLDVIDVVQIVSIILYGLESPLSDFSLEDINDNSPTFGEMIGPFFYESEVSCYYFGKAG